MRYCNNVNDFPAVTDEQRVFLKNKQSPYDYSRSLMEPIGFFIEDRDEIEHVDTVEDREWDLVTKLIVDHYVKVNGAWTYTCSWRKRNVDRKFRCVGGPRNGTNVESTVGRRDSQYIMFNCGESGIEKEFSALFMHVSLLNS